MSKVRPQGLEKITPEYRDHVIKYRNADFANYKDCVCSDGRAFIHRAVELKDLKLVRDLKAIGANFAVRGDIDGRRHTALSLSVMNSSAMALDWLIRDVETKEDAKAIGLLNEKGDPDEELLYAMERLSSSRRAQACVAAIEGKLGKIGVSPTKIKPPEEVRESEVIKKDAPLLIKTDEIVPSPSNTLKTIFSCCFGGNKKSSQVSPGNK